ncbi:general substrate transporter [Aspergillus pseudodeflectus]|uniref:General substrate transporter n=1 Tax=Aspergillus pseudodeflectus TaxID=176178 RepID=A0ABR4K7S3_9EURO
MDEIKASRTEREVVDPLKPSMTGTVGISDEILAQMSDKIQDFTQTMERAHRASEFEHSMTNAEAVKLFPKAIAWSFLISLSIIMEGYDTSLLGSFYAYPTFAQKFGSFDERSNTYQVSSSWQSGLQNGTQVGQIMGLMVAGLIADRFGYKKTMFGAMVILCGFIFLMFFAQNVGMLFAAELLCGLPWGAFQTLSVTYAAEVAPTILRPYLTAYVNLCWVTGQFISIGVLRGLLHRTDEWGWRIPYAIQWVWPLPIMVGLLFAPESPWWLVRHNRLDEARRSLLRLTTRENRRYDPDDAIALMVVTNTQEELSREGVSYWDCFRGTNLRRTEIACASWMSQCLTGIWFGGNITYFLQQQGFSADQSFNFGLGLNALAFLSTLGSWFVMRWVGRRKLYLCGTGTMLSVLLIVGFMGIPASNAGISYASAAMLMLFVLAYDLTVGPVCYALVSEIPSTRLRIKSAVLARNAYNITTIGANFLNPPILNPTAWNLRGKGGFIWAGFCFLCLVWMYFRLPEPSGRTPSELDVLFENKISARKFSETEVDTFRSVAMQEH